MISVCALPEQRLTLVKLAGTVTLEEVLRYVQVRLDQAPPPPVGGDTLVDLRALNNTHSYEEITRLSEELLRHDRAWAERRIALLVARDAHYGVGRMFGMVMTARTSANIGTFRELEDAASWLDRPLAEILAAIPAERWITPAAAASD